MKPLTMNCVMDLLKRMLPIMKENTENYAECCSINGTGLIEDITFEDDAIQIVAERALITEAEELLALFESQLNNPVPGYFTNNHYSG